VIPRDEIMISGIHALAILLSLTALLTLRERTPTTGTILSLASFVLQGLSFSLGTYQFYQIWGNLANGLYVGVSMTPDFEAHFGIGLYLSGGAVVCIFLASMLGWAATRSRSKSESLWV
jgi:hypothetical protein